MKRGVCATTVALALFAWPSTASAAEFLTFQEAKR